MQNSYARSTIEKRLSSGIPVIFENLPGQAAALYWWVSVGSEHEGKGEEGFAHFLEHMLFKDTAAKETGAQSTGKLARTIEGLGGDINAYTSLERTVYHVTCAETFFETVVKEFTQMIRPTGFLKSDFEREREVIIEEYRRGEDNPNRMLYESVFKEVFGPHPYARPVIGTLANLKRAKVKELEAFYRREYRPSQMGIVVVGPLSEARIQGIMRILERAIGAAAWPNRTPDAERPRRKDPMASGRVVVQTFDVKSPSLVLAFGAPSFSDPDAAALELAVGALGQGDLSRLYQELFISRSLVTDIGGSVFSTADCGMVSFHVAADSVEKLPEILPILESEISKIADSGISKAEHERLVVAAESEKAYAVQTVDGMASRLGFMRFVAKDLDFDRRSLSALKGTTPAETAQAAQRYLARGTRALVALMPNTGDVKGLKQKLLSLSRQPTSEPKGARTLNVKSAHPTLVTRPSGMRVVHYERPSSSVFSIHISCLGGVRLESGLHGVSHLLGEVWDKGTDQLTYQQLLSEFEGRAASVSGFSGRNSAGLECTGLPQDFTHLSALVTQVLTRPSFPERELADIKRVSLEQLKSLEDHSGQLCSKLFMETLFETHPYGRYPIGTPDSVKRATRDDIVRIHQDWVNPDRLVVSVSGNVGSKELEAWLSDLEARLGSKPKSAKPVVLEDEVLKAPRWVERRLGREQVHCFVGTLGTTVHSPTRFSYRILSHVLGGMGGRLFVELREKKSLAYSVHPTAMEGLERGYFGVYLACAPQKVKEAKVGMMSVLESVAKKGPSESELKRAKQYGLGRRAMDLQSDSALAAHYGLQVLYRGNLGEDESRGLLKVTRSDVKKVAEALVGSSMVTAEVG